jgi:RimJ/RimL family protein N-acetyltransferase
MKPGHIYKQFALSKGRKVTLRALRPEDIDSVLAFINTLVKEKRVDPKSTLYVGFDRKITRKAEAAWLKQTVSAIRGGEAINVVAEIDGKIIANGEVTRGKYDETRHYGHIGLTMIREYRGQGIGRRMIETLAQESRKAGLRTLDVEFLAGNVSARRAYERTGFKQAGLIPNKVFRGGRYFDGLIMARKL